MNPEVRAVQARRAACLLAMIACALLALAAPANAAFPGLDGKIAFVASNSGQYDIYAVSPNGTGQVNLTQSPEDDYDPTWSADGNKVAFIRRPGGTFGPYASHIYLMNAEGSGQIDITPLADNRDRHPAWSPDGSRLAFIREECDDFTCLYTLHTINASGTGETALVGGALSLTGPSWTPDGAWIVFEASDWDPNDTNPAIYRIKPDGTGLTKVFETSADMQDPDVSPDGSKIAIRYARQIATINSGGTGLKILTDLSTDHLVYAPAWSPDGTKIAFTSQDSSFVTSVNVINSSDGSDKTFFANGASPDWQPIPEPKRSDYRNGAQFCEADRAFLGDAEFMQKYGTNGNGANAFGKCVSSN